MFNERCRENVAHSKASICDLTQRPPFGKLEQLLPTLVTNHAPYCLECKKLLTPDESLMSQLLPDDHPAREMLKKNMIKDSHAKHLAGNTMNVASVGTVMLYLLSAVRRREPCHDEIFRAPSSSSVFSVES